MAGKIPLEDAYNARDKDGVRLVDELERIGYLGAEPCVPRPFRAYLELQGSFDPEEEHWTKLAEIEPVVAPYGTGETFDGWIVLPVMAGRSSYALVGSGFEPRSRLQIRASAYLVA